MNNVEFKKGDSVIVNLRNGEVIGEVIDVKGTNNDIVYVREGNDIFKFYIGLNDIHHNMINNFIDHADVLKKDYDVSYTQTQSITIEGSINSVGIEYDTIKKIFKMYTVNKERLHIALVNDNSSDPHKYAQGNTIYRKKEDSVIKFINKFV